MTHDALNSLLPAYALDALEAEELRALEAHLHGGCADCEKELAQYRRVAEGLLLSAGERSPRPEVKAALMERVSGRTEAAPRLSLWAWPLRQWRPLGAGFAALALLVWMWSGQGWMPRRGASSPAIPAAPGTMAASATGTNEAPAQASAQGQAPRRGAAGARRHAQFAALPRAGRRSSSRGRAALPALALRSGSVTQNGLAASNGGSLAWGPGLFSGKDGAEIVVDRRAVLLLKPYTQVNLSLRKAQVFADLARGTLFSAVVHGTAFSVRSGGAQVDAHGTMFLVSRVAANRVYVCICRGKIGVSAPGLKQEMAAADDSQEAGLNLTLARGGTDAEAAQAVNYAQEEAAVGEALRGMQGLGAVSGGKH